MGVTEQTLKQIFLWPAVMGLLVLFGLVVALLTDGLPEQVSLLAMGVPVIAMIYIYFFRRFMHR